MVLSKREQLILIVAVVCVGILVANRLVIDPVQAKLAEMEVQRTQLEGDYEEAKTLLDQQGTRLRMWKTQMPSDWRDGSEVESQVSSALSTWSRRSYLSLPSIKPDPGVDENGLQEKVFTVAGEGSLEAVTQFVYEIETSALPIKIRTMSIGSSSDAGRSMSLQLALSVLYPSTEKQPDKRIPEANNEDI